MIRSAFRRNVPGSSSFVPVAICSVALWWGSSAPVLASPDHEPVVGDASAIASGVELRDAAANAPYVLLTAIEPVAVGDGLRTDDTGYAEIAYIDGSRTRLDVDTEFEVVELVDDAGISSTRTSMEVGRTWHRVESLGEGEFTVETSQATATVRGTAFAIDCPTAVTCSYLVLSGIIELILADGSVVVIVGPAEVVVEGGVAGPLTPVAFDRVLGDPWLVDNVNRDTMAGFADLATIVPGSGVATTAPDDTAPPSSSPPSTSTTTTTEPSEIEPSTTTTTEPRPTSTTPRRTPSTTTSEPSPAGPSTSTTTTEPTDTEPVNVNHDLDHDVHDVHDVHDDVHDVHDVNARPGPS